MSVIDQEIAAQEAAISRLLRMIAQLEACRIVPEATRQLLARLERRLLETQARRRPAH
jgi:hypothetical protein